MAGDIAKPDVDADMTEVPADASLLDASGSKDAPPVNVSCDLPSSEVGMTAPDVGTEGTAALPLALESIGSGAGVSAVKPSAEVGISLPSIGELFAEAGAGSAADNAAAEVEASPKVFEAGVSSDVLACCGSVLDFIFSLFVCLLSMRDHAHVSQVQYLQNSSCVNVVHVQAGPRRRVVVFFSLRLPCFLCISFTSRHHSCG